MYFVTVSEMIGTGGEAVARKVAEKLNYSLYAKKELFEAAEEMGYLSDLPQMDLKNPHLLEKYFNDKPKIYLARFQSVIYELAKKGNGLFVGKGSQLLLHSCDCALHVLVIASMGKRIDRLVQTMKVEEVVAEKIIQTSDQNKTVFSKYAFDEEWLIPQLYDITINMDRINIETAVNLVVDAAQSEEIKACSADAVATLGKLAIHRKIEFALMEAGLLSLRIFFLVEDMETVRVYGTVYTEGEKEAIGRVVGEVKGVKTVNNDLTVLKH